MLGFSSLSHSASSLCFAPPQRAGLGHSQAPAQTGPATGLWTGPRAPLGLFPLFLQHRDNLLMHTDRNEELRFSQTAQKPQNNLLKFGAEPSHKVSPGKQELAEWLKAAKVFPCPTGIPGTQLQGGRRWVDTDCPSHSGITGVHTGLEEKGHIWHRGSLLKREGSL